MNKAASTISDERLRSGPIVVGVDGSNASRRALDWAVREAEAHGSGVLALSAYQMPAMAAAAPGYTVGIEELGDYCKKVLETEISAISKSHPSVQIKAKTVEGPAAQILIDASELASALVVGSRGHGGFIGLLLGSVSQQCVTHARCPVVVVRPSS
jgi:nucleotide-binding universal stress UspA family protein